MKILNANKVMKWVRVSEGKLPGLMAVGAIVVGLAAVAGAYGVGYLKAIRSERKKQSETEKTESVPSEDGVIGVDFTGETEAVEEDLITEKDQGDMVKGVAEMFLHDHTFHAAIAATVGLAYLAYKLKYAPIDNWGQLCYRTNKLNYRSCELFSDGLVRLLRRCADGASCYVSKESDEAVKALSVVAGDINGIFNNVSSLRSESFGYTR